MQHSRPVAEEQHPGRLERGVFFVAAGVMALGIGLAAAVLIDATIIRGVLLPATMKLLGDRNWWLPRKLGWLPQVSPEGEVQPATA